MRKVTLRSLWEHKRRLLSTILAVVLGVSFMAGTFIMSTTIDRSFNDLFTEVVEDVDVIVQGNLLFSDLLTGDQRANLPAALVDEVAGERGVAAAAPHVTSQGSISFNRVLGSDGKAIGGGGGVTELRNWIDDASINPFGLDHGQGPERDDEVVLNVAAAEEGHLSVGDPVRVITQDGPQDYTLVGTFALGAAKSAGGTVTVGFTLAEAQRLAGVTDEITAVYVRAEDGVSAEELVEDLSSTLRDQAEPITGEEAAAQLSKNRQTAGNFQFITLALSIFGGIALLVGIFVISNTFSILVAQRTRELALLRALGASRAQVLGSVVLEAAVVGAVASVLGVIGGLFLTRAVTAFISAAGTALPNTKLVVEADTIVVAMLIGVGVTVLASLMPALRATRVPPLAALRDVAVDRSNLSRTRVLLGIVALVVGAAGLSAAWRGNGDNPIISVAAGGFFTVVGFLVVGPVLAGRTVRLLGSPLPRFKGMTGRLATENASRSPKRTSATASAVVIGVALVVVIQVFSASASKSVRTEVTRGFHADFVVRSKPEGVRVSPGIPTGVAERVAKVPGVTVVSPLGFGSVGLTYPDGKTATHFVTALEPAAAEAVFTPRLAGEDRNGGFQLHDLTDEGVIVDIGVAEEHDMSRGDRITFIGPSGITRELTVQGVGDDRNLLGIVAITRSTFREISPQVVDIQVAGTVDDPSPAGLQEVLADVSDELSDLPSIDVLDRDGFIGSIVEQITGYIRLIQIMLVLSVVTALFGIANTLSLSINERVRELGLLRAVGMDRSSVRSSVRWEAFLIALLGAVVGLSLGTVLSVALTKAMESFGLSSFAFPGGWLGVIGLATAALGTAAAIRPARRAAALSILDAIATD